VNKRFSPPDKLRGTVRVPADKSIGHRSLILAAMTQGPSRIGGYLAGQDVTSTAKCLRRLGCEVSDLDGGEVVVEGSGWRPPPEAELEAGNSGTTMRLLAGALAGRRGRYVLTGDASLSGRPMGRVAEPLRMMGAQVELGEGSHPPLTVTGGPLKAITYALPVASAQVKGAVLLAGLQAEGSTVVKEGHPSRDHTERLLRWLGAKVEQTGDTVSVAGGSEIFEREGFELEVPGDLSSAAYLLLAAALCPEALVRVERVGLNPSRSGILEVLKAMGAEVEWFARAEDPEPWGEVTTRSSKLRAIRVDGPMIPRIVDELPLVALAATQAEGTTVIAGARELRVKESDRISVLAKGLRKLGARVEEQEDGLIVEGPTTLQGGFVDAAGDHRMALTFAVAGLVAAGPVEIGRWEAASVSYPGFESDLRSLAG
jgi:3-phosphoshikimate 1-carboxyvinyltransferase